MREDLREKDRALSDLQQECEQKSATVSDLSARLAENELEAVLTRVAYTEAISVNMERAAQQAKENAENEYNAKLKELSNSFEKSQAEAQRQLQDSSNKINELNKQLDGYKETVEFLNEETQVLRVSFVICSQ